MIRRLSATRIPGPKFAYTPCVRAGGLAVVSGMVALDPDTGLLVKGGVAEQTQRIFDNLALALPDYGLGWDELFVARVYLRDFSRFGEFNEVWAAQFADRPPPARTSLGVSGLPLDAAVEIEFTFVTGA